MIWCENEQREYIYTFTQFTLVSRTGSILPVIADVEDLEGEMGFGGQDSVLAELNLAEK